MRNHKNSFALALTLMLAVGCGKNSGSKNDGQNPYGLGPMAVNLNASGLSPSDLGSSGAYVILAKSGVSNTGGSAISGNIGVSPAAASYITGFDLVADASNEFSSSIYVNGNIYAANYSLPTPSNLTTAVGSMETAYTNAAGRSDPDFNELASGDLGGLTLRPGLYKWSSSVTIPSNVTLSGSSTDVWIFQIAGNLSMAAGVSVQMSGGALAKNVYWQVAGQSDFFASSHFEGILLCKTAVNFQTSASMNGRIYSQTEVSLQDNDIVQP
jgi:hypothetical protein